MSATIGGSGFGPIIGAPRRVVHTSFRDEINAYATNSVYATIKERAARQNTLQKVFAVMRDVGQRIIALEAARQRAQQHPSRSRCACGRSPCKCAAQQQPRISIGDTVMRNPSLAPSRHLTLTPTSRRARDQQNFGERPSRFTSEEAARMARHIVGAGPPSAEELNATHRSVHAGFGASGQTHDVVEQNGQTGLNRRGELLEARSSDLSEAFANELDKIPSGQPQAALNAYHAAYYKAKSPEAIDAIDKIWSAFSRT